MVICAIMTLICFWVRGEEFEEGGWGGGEQRHTAFAGSQDGFMITPEGL